MILKYEDFINEAKKEVKEKSIEMIFRILNEKPKINLSGKTFPDEKDAYSLAGLKKYFRDHDMTSEHVDDAIYNINTDKDLKSKLKSFTAKNFHYNQSYAYYYTDLTKSEVEKVKERIEEDSKELSKPEIEKRETTKKTVARKTRKKTTKEK